MAIAFLLFGSLGTSLASLINYSTDFTSADGFSDGNTANGVDRWVTRAQHITSSAGSFGALKLNSNGSALVHQASGGNWAVGDMIEISAGVFYTGNSQNNRLRIGLRETATATELPNAGVEFNQDATAAGNFEIDDVATGGSDNFGAAIDSGFDVVVWHITVLQVAKLRSIASH